jgi:cell wall-associated NlpC family hydrolase
VSRAVGSYGKVGGGAAGVPLAPRPTGFTAAPDKNLAMQQIIGELGHSQPDIGILSGAIQQSNFHPPPSHVQVMGHPAAAGASAVGESVAKIAERFVGTPYVWGGTTPKGFDCSGLIQYVWKQRGVTIPRTTYDQVHAGQAVKGPLQPGDAIFYRMGPRGPEHVAMFVGGGKMIEAPHRGVNARIVAVRKGYVAARRFG